MSEFANVRCRIPNGVVLRLYEKSEGPFGVTSYLTRDAVTLNGGDNRVDASFFDEWLEANSDNDLVKTGFIERTS